MQLAALQIVIWALVLKIDGFPNQVEINKAENRGTINVEGSELSCFSL